MSDPIEIVIIDDHLVVREGLKGILASQPDFSVVGEAADGATGVELVRRLLPAVALMDLRMPQTDGVSAITQLRQEQLPTRILVLTTYDTDADIVRAVEAGATGYLLKDTPREELYRAIRAAARGESVLAPTVATRLMTQMRTPAEDRLSQREGEVLQLLAEGKSNRAIGRALHISVATVKTHLTHIYDKLGVSDRTSAVTEGLKRGIVHL